MNDDINEAPEAEDNAAPEKGAPEKGERIAKRLARAGLCSRRDAERWIEEGRVVVDGVRLTTPAVVVTENSRIVVDGKPLPEPERSRLWRYHKPAGLVTSHKDEQGRPTVFDKMPEDMPRVISIGRLDLNSEGLLLLTNDGELARKLELPATGWVRRYRVRVHGVPTPEGLAALEKGLTIDGVVYGSIKALLDRQQGSNAWLTVSLKEGKNREIRRVMEHLGWTVSRLIRIAYGPFQLGLLNPGEAEEVLARVLQEQLGGAAEKPAKLHPAAPKDKDRTRDPGNKKLTLKNDPKAGTKFAAKSEAKAATKSDGNRANHARKTTSDKSSPRKPR
jgi:23S rRNA pseudouridine2605 synthase